MHDIGPCSSSQLARKSPYGRVKVCFSRPASDRTKGSGKPPKTRPSRKKPRDLPNELDFAHEVKQPITNLIYYASALSLLLQQLGVKDDRVEYALKQMNSQAKRTSDIVEHVRSYAKHKANRSEVFNLVEVIRRAINSINKEEIEGVQTTANLPQEAIAVGDSFEIELAVLNVLKNALKAAKNSLNPQTSVSVTAQKHMWKITITDNGPKISEEIFSALGRPTSTSKKDGLGVGLSIVLSIIENNGGHLTFRRIEPNGIAVDLFVKKKEE